MSHIHAVVWLDHREAQVIDFSIDETHTVHVKNPGSHKKVQHRGGVFGSDKRPDDGPFFDEIVTAIGDAREVLVVGPGTGKTLFKHHIDKHHAGLAKRVVGVETVDHPSEGELLAHARKVFKRIDNMLGDQR